MLLSTEVFIVYEGLVAIDFFGKVVLGSFARSSCFIVFKASLNIILFSFDIQFVLRLNLVLLLFLFLDTVHDTGLPVIEIDLSRVQVGLVLLFLVEDTLVDIPLFGSLLYSDALFVVSHILAESLGLKSDFMLGLVLVEFSLTGRIFKTHLHFFLCQEVVRSDRLDFGILSLVEAELRLNIREELC